MSGGGAGGSIWICKQSNSTSDNYFVVPAFDFSCFDCPTYFNKFDFTFFFHYFITSTATSVLTGKGIISASGGDGIGPKGVRDSGGGGGGSGGRIAIYGDKRYHKYKSNLVVFNFFVINYA